MKKATMLVGLLAMVVLVAAIPALATSTAYLPCSEMPSREFAQGSLDDPAFGPVRKTY